MKIRNRTRRKKENLTALVQGIRRLLQIVYPTVGKHGREELTILSFIRALDDPSLQLAVFQVKPQVFD